MAALSAAQRRMAISLAIGRMHVMPAVAGVLVPFPAASCPFVPSPVSASHVRPSSTQVVVKTAGRASTTADPKPIDWFNLHPTLIPALRELGITSPSPIQRTAIPAIASGADVILQASTGTGKTLAYLLPIADRLKREEEGSGIVSRPGRPRAVCIVPTRELAQQVAKVAKACAHSCRLSVYALVGGRKEGRTKEALQRPIDILVGTPGSVASCIAGSRTGSGGTRGRAGAEGAPLSLADTKVLVLDEVDTLLDKREGAAGSGHRLSPRPSIRGSRRGPGAGTGTGTGAGQGDDPDRGFLPAIQDILRPLRHAEVKAGEAAAAVADGQGGSEGREEEEAQAQVVQYILVGATLPAHAARAARALFPTCKPPGQVAKAMGSATGASVPPAMHAPPPTIRHEFVRVGADPLAKHAALMGVMGAALPTGTHVGAQGEAGSGSSMDSRRVLVFCNSVSSCRSTAHYLGEQGYSVACLHGAIPPLARAHEYKMYMEGTAPVLVATDAAARGLDIPGLSHAILFDFPLSPVEYLHRAGRVGRAGRKGTVHSLVGPGDGVLATAIERAVTGSGDAVDLLSLTGAKGQYVRAGQREAWKGAQGGTGGAGARTASLPRSSSSTGPSRQRPSSPQVQGRREQPFTRAGTEGGWGSSRGRGAGGDGPRRERGPSSSYSRSRPPDARRSARASPATARVWGETFLRKDREEEGEGEGGGRPRSGGSGARTASYGASSSSSSSRRPAGYGASSGSSSSRRPASYGASSGREGRPPSSGYRRGGKA